MKASLIQFLATLLLLVMVFFSFAMIGKSKENQELKGDYAQLNHIQYGMFSVYEWKRKVADVISTKITNFELTPINREQAKKKVESALHLLFDEVEESIKQEQSSSLIGAIKGTFVDVFVDKESLRGSIPEYADKILEEFDKEESRETISRMIQNKLDELVDESIGIEDRSVPDAILKKYSHTNIVQCSQLIEEKMVKNKNELWAYALILIVSFIAIWALLFKKFSEKRSWSFYIILVGIIILLLNGIITPMIDIDARIDTMDITFLGDSMEFTNQILFFQSKSILDVVILLFQNGGFQTILVAFLILLFSILFPLAKISATYFIIKDASNRRNKVINFLAFYSGKWSMADVFVVAIFMAYIGFSSIIENQMSQFNTSSAQSNIITLNETSLEPGFILFISFTLGSLLLSHILNKKTVTTS